MPCKHRRPGSIPGVSTCAIGIEEEGNLPDPESGETRFDSGGPDVTGCGVRVSAPALGAGRRGSSPCFPTCGSLVKSESRAVEAREVPGRFRGEPPRQAPLAQWLEQRILNPKVRGSSPWRRTMRE